MVVVLAAGPVLAAPPALAAQASRTPEVAWLPGSVRSAGLQGAGAALVGDASSVFTNPAGLATVHHVALEGTWRREAPRRVLTGALGWRLGQLDLGVGLQYLGHDTLAAGSSDAPYEALGVGSLVYRFGLMALGGSVRHYRVTTAGPLERATSGDLGLAIAVFDIMALAVSVQHVGGNWDDGSAIPLPRRTRAGFTMNYVDPQESFRLLSTIEMSWESGVGSRLTLGAEGGVVLQGVGLVARAAHRSRAAGSTQPGFTYGGSIALGDLQVDYAYAVRDALGDQAHRFGARLKL
ncbi:MAG TPA: hypothetical protein VF970_02270 [Gemmatimonadales bacterium]